LAAAATAREESRGAAAIAWAVCSSRAASGPPRGPRRPPKPRPRRPAAGTRPRCRPRPMGVAGGGGHAQQGGRVAHAQAEGVVVPRRRHSQETAQARHRLSTPHPLGAGRRAHLHRRAVHHAHLQFIFFSSILSTSLDGTCYCSTKRVFQLKLNDIKN